MANLKIEHHRDSTWTPETPAIPQSPQSEKAVRALKRAHCNLAESIYIAEKATPADQTIGDLIVKDILLLASVLFFPTMYYLLA